MPVGDKFMDICRCDFCEGKEDDQGFDDEPDYEPEEENEA